jgi:hypothetical protein
MDDIGREILDLARGDLFRRLSFPLEGLGAFEDIGDLVRVGMDVPGQQEANG